MQANQIRNDGPHERLGNSFGKVRNNFQKRHKGWDLSAAPNTPIYAISNGEIVQTFLNVSGYGKCLILEFANPKYNPNLRVSVGVANFPKLYALYAHLSQSNPKGKVTIGQVIGSTGVSGNAAGEPPHLHFEILLENALMHGTARVDPGEILGYGLYVC